VVAAEGKSKLMGPTTVLPAKDFVTSSKRKIMPIQAGPSAALGRGQCRLLLFLTLPTYSMVLLLFVNLCQNAFLQSSQQISAVNPGFYGPICSPRCLNATAY
jgi:hypothetical protein